MRHCTSTPSKRSSRLAAAYKLELYLLIKIMEQSLRFVYILWTIVETKKTNLIWVSLIDTTKSYGRVQNIARKLQNRVEATRHVISFWKDMASKAG